MSCRLRTLILVLAGIASAPTFGQDIYQLPEATTILRLRPEPLLKTSESVTVITKDELDENYREDLVDLTGVAPAFLVDPVAEIPGGAAISMRGIGSSDSSYGMYPLVAIKVDGVALGSPAQLDQLLFDVDRVEVAKGPQGVWQGVPAPNGAINLYRSKPTGKLSVDTHYTVGAYSRSRFDTVVNFPILSNLAGKVSYVGRRGGHGLMKNVFTGRRENEDQLSAASASFLWRSDKVNIQYTYDNSNDESDVPALLNLASLSNLVCLNSINLTSCSQGGTGEIPEQGNYRRTSQGFSNRRHVKITQQVVHADFDLAGFHFSSISALRNTADYSYVDADGTSVDFYSTRNSHGERQLSQEVNAWRNITNNMTLSLGLSLQNNGLHQTRQDLYVLKAISAYGGIVPATPDANRFIDTHQDRHIRTLFSALSWKLSDQWTVDAGLRGVVAKTYFKNSISQPSSAITGTTVPPVDVNDQRIDHEFSATLGVAYVVDDNDVLYARYSHGFRPGGFDDAANSLEASAAYRPEEIDAYEAGVKANWLDNRLHFRYTMYREDYKHRLERYTTNMTSGNVESILRNTSYIRSFGHEIEITAIPVDNLLVRANVNINNSDYIFYSIPDITTPGSNADLQSTIPPFAPNDQIRISAQYRFPWWIGEVRLYGAYRFTTSYWSNPYIPAGHVNTYTSMDLAVEYTWSHWQLRLFSENFNGKRYLTDATQTTSAQLASLMAGSTDRILTTTTLYNKPRFNGVQLIFRWSGGR